MSELVIVDNKAWKNEPMTEKQVQFISMMETYRFDSFPQYEGTTKGEANKYITKYRKTAYLNQSFVLRHLA